MSEKKKLSIQKSDLLEKFLAESDAHVELTQEESNAHFCQVLEVNKALPDGVKGIVEYIPESLHQYLKKGVRAFLQKNIFDHKVGKKFLDNFISHADGNYLNFLAGDFIDKEHSFKVLDLARVGYYSDIVNFEVAEYGYNPLFIKSFLDNILLYCGSLIQDKRSDFPLEVELAFGSDCCLLSVMIDVGDYHDEDIIGSFEDIQGKVYKSQLLHLAYHYTNIFDITALKNGSLRLTGCWFEKSSITQRSLLFSNVSGLESSYASNIDTLNVDPEVFSKERSDLPISGLEIPDQSELNQASDEGEQAPGVMSFGNPIDEFVNYVLEQINTGVLKEEDLSLQSIGTCFESYPEKEAMIGLSDDDGRYVYKTVKELLGGVTQDNGLEDFDEVGYVVKSSIDNTEEDHFVKTVKGITEEKGLWRVKNIFSNDNEKIAQRIKESLTPEDISELSREDIEEMIVTTLIEGGIEDQDGWIVKRLGKRITRLIFDSEAEFTEDDITFEIMQYAQKIEELLSNNQFIDLKQNLLRELDDLDFSDPDSLKSKVKAVVKDRFDDFGFEDSDEALDILADLLFKEKDELLSQSERSHLNKMKGLADENDKMAVKSLGGKHLSQELEEYKQRVKKLENDLKLKDQALKKQIEINDELSNEEVEQDDDETSEVINHAKKELQDKGLSPRQKDIIKKAIEMETLLKEARYKVKKLEVLSKRKDLLFQREIEKAMKKAETNAYIAQKAKAGMTRVANSKQKEIDRMKSVLDNTKQEYHAKNVRAISRVRELEKELQTHRSKAGIESEKLSVLENKFEQQLKDKDKEFEKVLEQERTKINTLNSKLKDKEKEFESLFSLSKNLQMQLKGAQAQEKKYKELIEKMQKELKSKAGSSEAGTSKAPDAGQGYVENRDKLIKANSKILELKQKLFQAEKERDNFARKAKESGGASAPAAGDSAGGSGSKKAAMELKRATGQIGQLKQENSELKNINRSLDQKIKDLEQEISQLKKDNAA